MPGFDVLSKDLPLFENHFIEASAGTGKTFAIENIVLRLLLEGISIEEILVVTFTNAATLELKRRIRKTIEMALETPLQNENLSYLLRKKLLRSLSLFDECQIQTIHGFCTTALFSDFLEERDVESGHEEMIKMVKDYLRTEISQFPTFQIDKLLRSYGYDLDNLIKALLKIATNRIPIVCGRSYEELKKEVFKEIEALKKNFNVNGETLFHDLLQHASCFKEMSSKQKEVKKEVQEELKRFSLLFEEEADLSFSYVQEMKEENRLKRGLKDLSLRYDGLLERLQKNIFPLLEDIQDDLFIFARLAEGVRLHLLKDEQIILHDDLLLMMEKKVKETSFADKIRAKYKAVLIDEFQDTDHLQWNIFSTLFNEKEFKGPLYLVGDPKQSIYRFRGADIYTYFQAKKSFKEESQKTLNRNYRSEPSLVKALNHLFSFLNPFLVLPKTHEELLCPEMDCDPKKDSTLWKDGKGSIHFILGEREEDFFTFIIEEIKALQIPLNECAVLVKDRFQAERFKKFAKEHNVHAVAKKSHPLTTTEAYKVLHDLLESLSHLHSKGSVEKILAGPLFSFDIQMIEEKKEEMTIRLAELKEVLQNKRFLAFFKALNSEDFFVELISKDGGLDLYFDLLQLVEILQEHANPNEYLEYLKSLSKLSDDDEMLQAYNIGLNEGIPLYTVHGSKGLEFEVVFALGLSFSSLEKRELILDPEKRVFTFSKEALDQEKLEGRAEKIRLFYVAATRAKKRLYLPYMEKEKNSPMAVFLEKAPLKNFHIPEITSSIYQRNELRRDFIAVKPPILFAPRELQFNFEPIEISSFSKMNSASHESVSYPENILPPGKETGIHLHKILDELPFARARLAKTPSDMIPLFTHLIQNSPLLAWKDEIAQMMYNVFHMSLPFTLADVDPKKTMKEMEFFYYSESQKCYLKGFIDLIFEYENKIYFIDWKSNYLEDYSPKSLEKALKDHNYYLQNEIYKEAISRYAALCSSKIGGSYYIFLRGIKENSSDGIISL